MEKTIPAGAAILLRFIAETETGHGPPACYDVVYGHNQGKLNKPLTKMTVDEVAADGPRRTRSYGSSAAGAYQFMRDTLDKPSTLADLKGEMKLTGHELFSGDLQDLLGYHLLKRRGYEAFVRGVIGKNAFAKNLAKEWASFPVLVDTKGAHRDVKRGQSYYAGDGLNKALIEPEDVEDILDNVLAVANQPAPPVNTSKAPIPSTKPLPAPTGAKTGFVAGLFALVAAMTFGFADWVSNLSCNLFNLWC